MEKQLQDLASAVANLTTLVTNLTAQVDALKKESAPAEIAGLKKTVNELTQSFNEMKGVTKAAVEERERERQYFVRTLAGNHKVPFSAADLEAKPIEELRKLAQMAGVENYVGQGGPTLISANGEEQRFAGFQPYWLVPKEQQKEGGR